MKQLSKLCQQYLDGECTIDQFIEAIVHWVDDATDQDLHLFATFIIGGEFNE